MGNPEDNYAVSIIYVKLPRRGSPPLTFHSFIMKAFAVVLVLCLAGLAAALRPTAYCINLEQHADRRHHMEEVFSAANLANVNWEGVDGSSLSEEELNKYSFLTEGTRAKLLPAELGAALSPTSASGERLPPPLLPSPWSLKMTLSSPQPSCTTWSQLSLSSLRTGTSCTSHT